MYGILWKVLPGPWWLRVIFLGVMFVAAVYVCVRWVYPVISPDSIFGGATMDDATP